MSELAKSEAIRRAVKRELWLQYRKSMKQKVWLLITTTIALAIIVGLDVMKEKLKNHRDTPYTPQTLLGAIPDASPVLREAAEKLANSAEKEERYAKPEDALNALLAKTPVANALAKKQVEIRARYQKRLAEIDDDMQQKAIAAAARGTADIAALKARRAELVTARSAEFAEAEKAKNGQIAEFAKRLGALDRQIRAAVEALPPPERNAAKTQKEIIEELRAQRKEIIDARAAELSELGTPANEEQVKAIKGKYQPLIDAADKKIAEALQSMPSPGLNAAEQASALVASLKAQRTELAALHSAQLADQGPTAAEISITNRYKNELAAVDAEIAAAMRTHKDVVAAETAKAALVTLKARRAELVAARSAELTEAENGASAVLAELKEEFNTLDLARTAKERFDVSSNLRLNDFARDVVDPEHPLSIIYDVVWYASLIIGVIAFVALILTPLFRALPGVSGAEETFMEQIRSLFTRGPRAVGAGMARVVAMTVGTAAVVSVATTAPSSPLYDNPVFTQPVIEQSVIATTSSQKTSTSKPGTSNSPDARPGSGQTATTPPPVTSTAPPTTGPSDQTPPPAGEDPLKKLQEEVNALKDATAANQETLTTHDSTLDDHNATLGTHDEEIKKVERLPERVAGAEKKNDEQDGKFDDVFASASETQKKAAEADSKATSAAAKADKVEENVSQAKGAIEKRANQIQQVAAVQYKLGERPGLLRSVFGFDRYRITQGSVAFLRQADVPRRVVLAVSRLQCKKAPEDAADSLVTPADDTPDEIEQAASTSDNALQCDQSMSNDRLRRVVREELCRGPHAASCESDYTKWRDIVIRAARW